ncbi:uncharacterized protein Dwil_GK18941 [Drosophila willistoni]|uniref:Uncharacterized protein n=1 Tax=Drosophila willistoni TaxID=7260 RepID=A0A0Q9X2D9_DROWI|nr:uncharacterized protein Dwil_GK18941 [Drosophila willistoni]
MNHKCPFNFLGNTKSGNPVIKYFYGFFAPYTNANHSCPFNHDIMVNQVPTSFVDYRMTQLLPFPEGDYMIDLTAISWETVNNFILDNYYIN